MADDPAVLARKKMRAAMEAHDHDAVLSLLAPDVVLYSPVIGLGEFRGQKSVGDLYAAIIEGFKDYKYTAEMEGDGKQLLMFCGTLGGKKLEGVDTIIVDDEGRISEMTVMLRPLSGVIAFLVKIGPLIAKRRSPARALILRAIGPPFPLIASMVEFLAPRLINLGEKRR